MDLNNTVKEFYYEMTINELRLMNMDLRTHNITYNSLLYLDIIAFRKSCTVSYIAKSLNIAKSAVTLKVNELMKQGFVVKTQSSTDKRVNYLTLHPDAEKLYQIYDRVLTKCIDTIQKEYSENDIAIFCGILQRFSEVYSEEQENEQPTS